MNLGSWKIDDILTIQCNTHSPSTGNAADADGAPAYRLYENITTAPIVNGSLALLDSVNTTGLYVAQVTLSAANGFEKGKCYTVYIQATVGGITGTLSHFFQIEAEVSFNSITAAGAIAFATAYLKFDESLIASGEALHSPLNAHRAVRRSAVVGAELVIYKANGTEAFRVPILTAAGDPITSVGKP